MDKWKSTARKKLNMEKVRREKIRDGESQKREDAIARKGRKSRSTLFFQCFVALEGRKVGSLKRRVRSAEPAGQMRDEKLHAVVARSTFGSKK